MMYSRLLISFVLYISKRIIVVVHNEASNKSTYINEYEYAPENNNGNANTATTNSEVYFFYLKIQA